MGDRGKEFYTDWYDRTVLPNVKDTAMADTIGSIPDDPKNLDDLSLGQKQRQFTRMIAQLIEYAYSQGYELTFGDAYRDPRLHGAFGKSGGYGSSTSVHKQRLAVDFNLFKDGEYLSKTSDHKFLGTYWEGLGGEWGGRFSFGDGNHYSLEHNGYK